MNSIWKTMVDAMELALLNTQPIHHPRNSYRAPGGNRAAGKRNRHDQRRPE